MVSPSEATSATPNVIHAFGTKFTLTAPIRIFRRFFDNFNEASQLIHSSIFCSGFPGAAAHLRQARRIAAKSAKRGGYCGGIIRIGRQSATRFANDAGCIGFCVGHGEHGAPRRENRIELAGNNDTLESPPDSNDVNVTSHHDVRNLLEWAERKKSNIRRTRRRFLQHRAVCPVTYEHEAGIFAAENFCGIDEGLPRSIETEVAGM